MRHPYLPAVGVGIIAGVRSLAAPALVSRRLRHEHASEQDALADFMSSSIVSGVIHAAAAAEIAADKTSLVPDRIAWPSLAWRAASGGLAGSVLASTTGHSRLVGGLVAAAAAVGATYAAFYLRQALGERLHLPDRLLGAAEDSLVLGAGYRLLRAAG